MAEIITKICNVLTILILACVPVVVGALLISRLADYETFAVLNGSMEPYYHTGSVIFADKSVTPEEVKVGGPITFTRTNILVATHRVTDIDNDKRELCTRGDANVTEDALPASFDMPVRKTGMSVPLLGYIPTYMKAPKGMFGIAAVLIVTILFQLTPELVKPEKKRES